jgi:uncharacterized membrane protein YeaQ/YmgE (transglycosylase-associated protein family)
MWDLLVFALTGLLTGAAARIWYPGREPMQVLGTMLLGMTGAVLGGLLSWAIWPNLDGQLHAGALLTSLFGAALAVLGSACWVYFRGISMASAGGK